MLNILRFIDHGDGSWVTGFDAFQQCPNAVFFCHSDDDIVSFDATMKSAAANNTVKFLVTRNTMFVG